MQIVQLADAWLSAEAVGFGPHWGGPRLSTMAKIREAMEVATSTGEGRNAIAKSIGADPTLISQWARRFHIDVIPPRSTQRAAGVETLERSLRVASAACLEGWHRSGGQTACVLLGTADHRGTEWSTACSDWMNAAEAGSDALEVVA